jgi:vitamin B12/bleomycin/antimicrobial peptide transport system ATP-binding/permease protein
MGISSVSQGNVPPAPIIGWIFVRAQIPVGAMSVGEVAQITAAFVVVLAPLNWLVDNYSGLADCLSSVNLVGSRLVALDDLECNSKWDGGGNEPQDAQCVRRGRRGFPKDQLRSARAPE